MTTPHNPYNPLQPTDDPAFFFGRAEALAFLRQNLAGTPGRQALVIIGRRGLGKSALLHQLADQLDDRYRMCLISLAGLNLESPEEFIVGLTAEIRSALEQAEASTYRLPEWPPAPEDLADEAETAPPTVLDWFNQTYLPIALAALRFRYLLLAFDDMHLLLDAIECGTLPADLPVQLAGWLAAHERLAMVCTLDASYENQTLRVPLLNNPALCFRLTELTPAEAAQLVREPVRDLYYYESGVEERILALGGEHPFLLHSICRLLFRRSEERSHSGPVTLHDLNGVYEAVLEQAGEILGPLWESAAHNERITLHALAGFGYDDPQEGITFDALYVRLAETGYILNKTQLAATLRSLEYKGLVRGGAGGKYLFPAQLIPAWLEANTSLQPPPSALQRVDMARLAPALGLIAGLLIVGGLGAAALLGLFDTNGDNRELSTPAGATATLALNLEATRRADFATQTEAARPTLTPTPTSTASRTPTFTRTPRPSTTPLPSATATASPAETQAATATRTLRPTASATLAPEQ